MLDNGYPKKPSKQAVQLVTPAVVVQVLQFFIGHCATHVRPLDVINA